MDWDTGIPWSELLRRIFGKRRFATRGSYDIHKQHIANCFYRMDKAKITSIDVAINKAFTAAGARKATHEYAEIAGAGGPAFGIHVSNRGRFMIFGGGLPIFVDGHIVGGIGCSSGSVEEDRIVAHAGIAPLTIHYNT